jgi:hypothetical protein
MGRGIQPTAPVEPNMSHNTRDIPAIAKAGGTRAAAGALTCTPDGKLYSYNLLIAETREYPDEDGPVFVVYDERKRHSVTTSKHVGFAIEIADVVAPHTAKGV